MSTRKYTVLSNLSFDGKHYPPGKTVELNDEQAEPLIGSVVEPAKDEKKEPAKSAGK